MTLNLIKLCVGVSSVEELSSWIDAELANKKQSGIAAEQIHNTRMVPKRIDELLNGGSLYWVIKANIQCRQRLLDIRPYTDAAGINRCQLVIEPKLQLTRWQPYRAFQGWRYLTQADAPQDDKTHPLHNFPAALRQELADLGLL